jgi:hypothetical protein
MDWSEAAPIGERLAQLAKAEAGVIIAHALNEFPSGPSDGPIWKPDEPRAHWLDGSALVSAVADSDEVTTITAWPVAGAPWAAAVEYRWVNGGNIVARYGFESRWDFELAGGKHFSITSFVAVTRGEESKPRDGELLARSILKAMFDVQPGRTHAPVVRQ